jgi:hypothetical protein
MKIQRMKLLDDSAPPPCALGHAATVLSVGYGEERRGVLGDEVPLESQSSRRFHVVVDWTSLLQ